MRPEDVPAELVEKAARAVYAADPHLRLGVPIPWDDLDRADIDELHQPARHALAAVLPDARYAAKLEAVTEARKVISQYLATAEKWRYDRVMWAFAIMLGEIPEDSPCPDSPADARKRAARLTAMTERPTDA